MRYGRVMDKRHIAMTAVAAAALWASSCASTPDTTNPTAETAPHEAPDDGTTTPPETTVRATSTIDRADNGRTAVALTMCSEVGYDAAFGIDWCDLSGDDLVISEMVDSSCDLLDSIDPAWTATDDQLIEAYATIDPAWTATDDQLIEAYATMSMALVVNGDATIEEATTMATLNGAVAGLRDDLCR